jgi:putative endonuclease
MAPQHRWRRSTDGAAAPTVGEGAGSSSLRTPAVSDSRGRVGALGEALAAAHYLAAGYEVLDRNWRCREGEIDLVCRLGATVVICEVKTRRSLSYGSAVEAVTPAKRRRLRRLGARWLREHRVRCATVRFDVAAVTGTGVELVLGAW